MAHFNYHTTTLQNMRAKQHFQSPPTPLGAYLNRYNTATQEMRVHRRAKPPNEGKWMTPPQYSYLQCHTNQHQQFHVEV